VQLFFAWNLLHVFNFILYIGGAATFSFPATVSIYSMAVYLRKRIAVQKNREESSLRGIRDV